MSILYYPLVILLTLLPQAKDYLRIHREAVVVDTHNDLLMRVMEGDDVERKSSKGHSDLVRFREGGYDGQVFSIWVDPKWETRAGSSSYADRMIDSLDAIIRRNPDKVVKVTNGAQFDAALRSGKLAAMLGMEGGHPIENSIDKLVHFYRRGVRYLSATWNNSTAWATSARDESTKELPKKGLTDLGRRIIHVMDSLGMLVDVSHCGERTVFDIAATTKNPIIASHSAVHRICPHYRNLKDDQIRLIAKSGGVVMINFYPSFIDSSYEIKKRKFADKGSAIQNIREGKGGALQAKYRFILPTVKGVADHIDYVRRLVGIDHVGIGADYDGIDVAPTGLEEVTRLPNLTKELLMRGYTEDEVKKVLGGNFLRVFRQVCGQ